MQVKRGYFCFNSCHLKRGTFYSPGNASERGYFCSNSPHLKRGIFYNLVEMQVKRGIFSRPKFTCLGYLFQVKTRAWKQPLYRTGPPGSRIQENLPENELGDTATYPQQSYGDLSKYQRVNHKLKC